MPAEVYFQVTDSVVDDLDRLQESTLVSEPIKKFVHEWAVLASRSESLIRRKDFVAHLENKELPNSPALVSKRIGELEKIGCVTRRKFRTTQGGAASQLTLKSLHNLFDHYARPDAQQIIPSHGVKITNKQLELQIDHLSQSGNYLYLREESSARLESLFCILDASMRLSGRDKRKNFSCRYHFNKNDYVTIEAATLTRTGGEIAQLSDQRAMRALNGVVLNQIEKKYGPAGTFDPKQIKIEDEYFVFDIYELCRRMGMAAKPAYLDLARKMVDRLRDTEYLVDATNSEYFRSNYAMGADQARYRYIVESFAKMDTYPTPDGERALPSERYYVVKFHSAILMHLVTTGRSFITHQELMTEKSGLAHRLNNWAKAVVGVRPVNDSRLFEYTLDELHRRVIPSARVDNFERDFLSLMQRQCKSITDEDGNMVTNDLGEPLYRRASTEWMGEEGETVVWLYGYYYHIKWDEYREKELRRIRGIRPPKKSYPIVRVVRDTEDPYVGDNSDHNKALRRTAAEIGRGEYV